MTPQAPISVPIPKGSSPTAVETVETEVFIVGSGPIGAVFARTLVNERIKVLMIDVGAQEGQRVGDHKKNSVAAQKNISLFTNTVKGALHPLSVPTKTSDMVLEPSSWEPRPKAPHTLQNGQNPLQDPQVNLPAAAATRVVGGMGTHWTCCTPRQNPTVERSNLFSDAKWDSLYTKMEEILNTNETTFENSIRHQLVKSTLEESYPGREIRNMPLACKASLRNPDYIEWSCPATILGDLSSPRGTNPYFEMRPNTQCLKLKRDDKKKGEIEYAEVVDLSENRKYRIKAQKYVVCAGAVLTPGILFNSGFRTAELPALGHYLTEQPMAFCQIVLKESLVDKVWDNFAWKVKAREHQETHPTDPLPFPFKDLDPQVYFPLTEKHPWHTQIHRDAFGYGEVPPTIDQRLVVDLRWFGYVQPEYSNYVSFESKYEDGFGMPQPTFNFVMNDSDSERCHRMITDMVDVARNLGGFLPGAEPKYLAPGSALHICGTHRAGRDSSDSVVNKYGQVWGQKNLVLGGCGVIPTGNACNPTITAGCFALAAARGIIEDLGKGVPAHHL